MEKTCLVQRLQKPRGHTNPFNFGGGLKNGGLSNRAMNMISGIWSFDYMGSAEFEWEAVPEALTKIWNYCAKKKGFADYIPLAKDIFYLCKKEDEYEVKKTITNIAMNKQRLKKPAFLKEVLDGEKYFEDNYWGWLELDNGFMFFTDKEMYEKTLNFFEIKTPVWL